MKNFNRLKLIGALCLAVLVGTFTSCKEDEKLSALTGLTSFTFTNDVVKEYKFTIDQKALTITNETALPYQFDVTKLVAEFEAIEKATVKVGTTEQVSGTTANDYSSPVQFSVTAEDGVTVKTYTVTVLVSDVNPEEVQWNQLSPNPFGDESDSYETQAYYTLGDKHFMILGNKFVMQENASNKLFSSEDGTTWTEETIVKESFPMGFMHNIVNVNGTLYVIQHIHETLLYGLFPGPEFSKHTWSSTDGITWTKSENVWTSAFILGSSFVVNDKIYLVGGNASAFGNWDGSKASGNVFYSPAGLDTKTYVSSNGKEWTATEITTAELPLRRYAATFVINNEMYLCGGQGKDGVLLNDIWKSTDGLTWTQVPTTGWAACQNHKVVVYDNKLWMFGGQLADGNISDELLISEDNGATWKAVGEEKELPAEYTARAGQAIKVMENGELFIIGGYKNEFKDNNPTNVMLTDVWKGKLNKL